MIYKPYCDCGRKAEGSTGRCGTCNRLERKFATAKIPDDPKPIEKVSDHQSKLLAQYAKLRKRFLYRRWCAYHGKPCIPTTVHHAAGRIGFIDEEAREQNIPALLDVRYFIPLCIEAHKYIEEHPKFAKENGYSEDRLSVKNTG